MGSAGPQGGCVGPATCLQGLSVSGPWPCPQRLPPCLPAPGHTARAVVSAGFSGLLTIWDGDGDGDGDGQALLPAVPDLQPLLPLDLLLQLQDAVEQGLGRRGTAWGWDGLSAPSCGLATRPLLLAKGT